VKNEEKKYNSGRSKMGITKKRCNIMTIKAVCDICSQIIYDKEYDRDDDKVKGLPGFEHFCSSCYPKVMKILKALKEKESRK